MDKSPSEQKSSIAFQTKVALAAGLYPLLHYYNGNFDISDTWLQLGFMVATCLLFPMVAVFVTPFLLRWLPKQWQAFLERRYLIAVNLVCFFGFLAFFIFHYKKKATALVLLLAGLLAFLLYKHLKKVITLQLLLAFMSAVWLLPKLYFMLNYNDSWTSLPDPITNTKFVQFPNVYIIQPDGYTNRTEMRESSYNMDNDEFEAWLEQHGFAYYEGFRSNYYSTLTSNSSMFAMKHHKYQNTFPGNLKTYASQEVIVGDNPVLSIFKNNGYKTHLITDNSFFLTNRKLKAYDYCNIPQSKVLLYDTGGIYGIDIPSDFKQAVSTQNGRNFYFVEKTLPSHIMYTKNASNGAEQERIDYISRVEEANEWLKHLVNTIEEHDENPLIILVADHGGFVGLDYVKQVEHRELNAIESISVFSSLLSIKWPDEQRPDIDFDTNVNLFRTLFSYLGNNPELLKYKETNESYIPLYDGLNAKFYQCLDDNGQFGYQLIEQ